MFLVIICRISRLIYIATSFSFLSNGKCFSFLLQIVLDDLSRAREGFVLASDLHLVYLATPTNVDVEPDWELFYERFMQLSSIEQVLKVFRGVF